MKEPDMKDEESLPDESEIEDDNLFVWHEEVDIDEFLHPSEGYLHIGVLKKAAFIQTVRKERSTIARYRASSKMGMIYMSWMVMER